MICANPTCNNDFEFDRKQPKKKYCSDRCRRKVCRRTYRSAHKYKPETRHCANPECGGMFDGKRANTIYCSERCRNRVKNIKEIERRRAAAPPKPEKPSRGIAPLRTPRITAARRREQALIDKVVAKALANGNKGGLDIWKNRPRRLIRATKVG